MERGIHAGVCCATSCLRALHCPICSSGHGAEANHCQETMQHEMSTTSMHEMAMQAQPESSPMSACSHCSSPENFALFTHDLDISPSDLLFAFVVLESSEAIAVTTPMNFIKRAQAPPRSSTTLYNTTQRIRI